MNISIRCMTPDDIPSVVKFWKTSTGSGLGASAPEHDSPEVLLRFLLRNPTTSYVAVYDTEIVGFILAGHDGRRGSIHHLVVMSMHRGLGLGRALVEQALTALRVEGITRVHVMFRRQYVDGQLFWRAMGCKERLDMVHISILLSGDNDAKT